MAQMSDKSVFERLIPGGKPCANDHQEKSGDKQGSRFLTENQKRQEDTCERGNSIVGTCSRGSKESLCIHVKVYAESVCYKSKQQDRRDRPQMEDLFSQDETCDNGSDP